MYESYPDKNLWPLTCDLCGQPVRSVVFLPVTHQKTCLSCSTKHALAVSSPPHPLTVSRT